MESFKKKVGTAVIRSVVRLLTPQRTSTWDSVLDIPSRDSGRTIKAHIYNSTRATDSSGPNPVLVNFHGSGFMVPMHGSDDGFCHHIATSTSSTVFDIQYRLTPEHPYPAAPNDVEDVVKYVLSQPEKYDAGNLSLSGFSAGATLALAGCTIFPKDTFRAVIAFYPVTDLDRDPTTRKAPLANGHPIPAPVFSSFNWCYIPPGEDRKVVMISCAYDTLCDEAEELADKIEKGGKSVVKRLRVETDHGWNIANLEVGSEPYKAREDAYALSIEVLS